MFKNPYLLYLAPLSSSFDQSAIIVRAKYAKVRKMNLSKQNKSKMPSFI